jgi:hypothetical protein
MVDAGRTMKWGVRMAALRIGKRGQVQPAFGMPMACLRQNVPVPVFRDWCGVFGHFRSLENRLPSSRCFDATGRRW